MTSALMTIILAGENGETQQIRPYTLSPAERERFEKAGFIHRGRDLTEIPCDCGESPLATVRWIGEADRQTPVKFCPNCGVSQISPEEIRCWEVDLPIILEQVAKAAMMASPVRDIPDLTWSLGRKRSKNLCYLRRFDMRDRKNVLGRYVNNPGTVFLVSREDRAKQLREYSSQDVIALEPFLDEENAQIRFDQTQFNLRLDELSGTGGKKRAKRSERLIRIEKLTQTLSEYIRAIIDNADAGKEIPRRPTQAWLGNTVGISQADVSNCLKDEAGRQLRYLWENMETYQGLEKIRPFVRNV